MLLAQNELAIAMHLSVRIKEVEVSSIWALWKGARKNTTNGKIQSFNDSEAPGQVGDATPFQVHKHSGDLAYVWVIFQLISLQRMIREWNFTETSSLTALSCLDESFSFQQASANSATPLQQIQCFQELEFRCFQFPNSNYRHKTFSVRWPLLRIGWGWNLVSPG